MDVIDEVLEANEVYSRTHELRRLTRFATLVAILTSPSAYYWFHHHNGWGVGKSLLATQFVVGGLERDPGRLVGLVAHQGADHGLDQVAADRRRC